MQTHKELVRVLRIKNFWLDKSEAKQLLKENNQPHNVLSVKFTFDDELEKVTLVCVADREQIV